MKLLNCLQQQKRIAKCKTQALSLLAGAQENIGVRVELREGRMRTKTTEEKECN